MTAEISSSDWSRFRAYLAYVAICVTVLLGSLGARWYLHVASTNVLATMAKNEDNTGKAHTPKVVTELVRGREILEGYHLFIAILVGVCLVAVATGLVQALYHMWLSSSGKAAAEVCFPRGMVITLIWQMAALWLVAVLVQFWF